MIYSNLFQFATSTRTASCLIDRRVMFLIEGYVPTENFPIFLFRTPRSPNDSAGIRRARISSSGGASCRWWSFCPWLRRRSSFSWRVSCFVLFSVFHAVFFKDTITMQCDILRSFNTCTETCAEQHSCVAHFNTFSAWHVRRIVCTNGCGFDTSVAGVSNKYVYCALQRISDQRVHHVFARYNTLPWGTTKHRNILWYHTIIVPGTSYHIVQGEW